MSTETVPGDAQVIRDISQQAVEPYEIDPHVDYLISTPSGSYTLVDTEKLREHPTRASGTYKPETVASFIDYVEKHSDKEATTVWVHSTQGKVVAVLDDHSAKDPNWGKHRVALDLVTTPEWTFWTKLDGTLVDQEAFANHLQDGLPDILEPDGATLLEIAQTFQVKTGVNFRKGVDITSGEVKFTYDEEQQAKAGKAGDVEVPRQFKLYLAPFVGEEKVELNANLRWRTGKGEFAIGYKLEHPERVIETVLEGIRDRLAKKFTRVYTGQPA